MSLQTKTIEIMEQTKPLCFVVMGYGKKQDPSTGRMLDLDVTYKKIIRPAVLQSNCRCVRGDEIKDSGLIDKSMYALLYRADIVIADISTYNPNAVYELGVRHVLKPYSTIVIREENSDIPFDLDHVRILSYSHMGRDITDDAAKTAIAGLRSMVVSVCQNRQTDSPIYSMFSKMTAPSISVDDINAIVKSLHEDENTIYSLRTKAEQLRKEKKYVEAEKVWKRLREKVGDEKYFIQQQALCRYKSESPSKIKALTDALTIISDIRNSDDAETLGITGAIYKRLWEMTHDLSMLDDAIKYYSKGWMVLKDYYNGENYANCIRYKQEETSGEEKIYYQVLEEKVRREIMDIILDVLDKIKGPDRMWRLATLANCSYALGDIDNGQKYEAEMMGMAPEPLAVETFNETKSHVLMTKKR